MTVISSVPRGDVTATLNFYTPPADNSPPYNLVGHHPDHPPHLPTNNYGDDFRQVLIHDIRGRESSFTLDRDAFQILQDLPPSKETAFADDAAIKANYYPEVERILLDSVPGAESVYIFDHTIRRSQPDAHRSPVLRVHIDQTASSVEKRIRRYFPAPEAEALLQRRYRIINVWKPLNKNPVEDSPLAVASSSSLDDKDVIPVQHRYADGYVGETAAINYNPAQRWYYLSGMTDSERYLLECFDSESLKPGSSISGKLPHTAFEDPRTRPDAEGRESIEVRALVFGA